MAVETKKREQLNISLAGDSALVEKLRSAERMTGYGRSHIARAVLDLFLGAWLDAEEARREIIDAARSSAKTGRVMSVSVRDTGQERPPYRGDQYRPDADYWRAVEARRPMPPEISGHYSNVAVRDVGRQSPPRRDAGASRQGREEQLSAVS